LAGSIGVIEEFFDAELATDSSHRAGRAAVITPARIAGLPWEQREALFSALIAHGKQPAEDYRRALQSGQDGPRPTMLLAWPTLGGYRTLEDGLRVVAYLGRVLVDDPLRPGTLLGGYGRSAPDERLPKLLDWLAEVRPLVAGGHIMFFPEGLAEWLRDTDPAIAEENAQRVDEHTRELEESVGGAIIWHDPPQSISLLDRLAASVGLAVDAMDTTGDAYVLKYLGQTLTAVPTSLASVQLPRLDQLRPRELAALLSSDEILAEVRSVLDDALRNVPEGLANNPELAADWINGRLADNLEAAVHRLRHSIRRLPDAVKIGAAAGSVGASVLSGALTASPAIALGVGAAGAAADLTASWLHQWQQHRKQQPAIRVLIHLASNSSRSENQFWHSGR